MAIEKAENRAQSRAELLAQVERHTWLYSVDLGEGLQTKGLFGPPHPYPRCVEQNRCLQQKGTGRWVLGGVV